MEKNNFTKTNICLYCNSDKIKKFYSQSNWTVYKCKSCGFIFTNPFPKKEIIHRYYDYDYFKDERHVNKFFNTDGSLKYENINYNNRVVDIENEFEKRGYLLEIGAAHGEFLNVMQQRGWSVKGVEISEAACKIAKDKYNIDLFNGNFLDYDCEEKFDVICMYQTLEHVHDFFEHLLKAKEMLNKEGIIVVEVPNVYAFDMMISKKRRWYSYDLPRHLNHFYPVFLKKVANRLSLDIISLDTYYPNFIIKLYEIKKKLSNNKNTNIKTLSQDNYKNMDLERKHITTKGKILKKFLTLLPGWRFTIIMQTK
ncbi:MAG TPA: methyltransferase domain-containing protein [Salinivirgaceae bacterium]|nr:methyltransferase domain-containing protein [Salinivirgaceae bacterium]HQA76253.1 methyltransferase domain-containing protein [Salinivirgaceae bacterium]